MEEKKNILTYEGLKKYEEELHELKVNKRQEVAQKIKEAREEKAAETEEMGKGEASGGIGNLDKIKSENEKMNEPIESEPEAAEPKEEESRG